MRVARLALLIVGISSALLGGGCGRKSRPKRHPAATSEAASALVPTPDNTPVAALRTPAGLVLKTGPEPTATPPPEGSAPGAASTKAAP